MDVTLKNVTYWEARAAPSFLSSVLQRPDHKVAVPELRKILLNDASIRFSPGSVTALYGYGSGSIALMNILKTQQKVVGHMSGSILYDHSIRSVGAYCDIACVSKLPLAAFFDLSVHDFLFWAAKLRINVSSTECRCVTYDA